MSRKSVFKNAGTGFSSLEILQEPGITGRSTEIVRFEIP